MYIKNNMGIKSTDSIDAYSNVDYLIFIQLHELYSNVFELLMVSLNDILSSCNFSNKLK